MPSLAILVPLYPSLCILLSSLLMIYLYRRPCTRLISRTWSIFRKHKYKTKTRKQGRHYTQLQGGREEVELESGLESASEQGVQSDDEESENEEDQTSPSPETTTTKYYLTPTSPLSVYFNAHSSLIHPHLLSPTVPPTPGWERRLRRRIDEGRGLGAWKDRLVEGTVRWLSWFSS